MKYFLSLVFFISIPSISIAQIKSDLVKITADDRAEGDCFGWSTSIYDNYCVVGTPQKKAKKPNGHMLLQEGGGAYIFSKQKDNKWIQTQLLLPDKPKSSDYFGTSVSMYGTNLSIGCNGDDDIESNSDFLIRQGAVYMFKLNEEGKWVKTQKIVLKERSATDNFGEKVFLYKDKMIVSAPYKTFNDSKSKGAVYIYEQTNAGGWIQKNIIKNPESLSESFGDEICISDSLLVISSKSTSTVYVYKLNKTNKWDFTVKLNASNTSDVGFGSSVFINDKWICVGAYGEFDHKIETNTALNSFRERKLLGAGSVYLYKVDNGNKCVFQQRIIPSDVKADMHFGNCLSMSDRLLVIGAFGDKVDKININDNLYSGAAYLFKQNNKGEWIETKKIVSQPRSSWDKFAFSVSSFGKTVIIGSRFEKENSSEKNPVQNAGAAYICEDK